MKKALLFGSIGAIMETSDIQRRAYNRALQEAGLPWVWNLPVYADLLEQSGGKDRLAMLAAATGFDLPQAKIDMIHARKMEIACAEIVANRTPPRPGVIRRKNAADKGDHRQRKRRAVRLRIAQRIDIPPGIATGTDRRVERRAKPICAAAN